jgi:sarcosine oxidase subunit alpha
MSEELEALIEVFINGRPVAVIAGSTAAAALIIARAWRKSVQGEARAPVCGMGICFECRARVNGEPQVRTCQVVCTPGMAIDTE